ARRLVDRVEGEVAAADEDQAALGDDRPGRTLRAKLLRRLDAERVELLPQIGHVAERLAPRNRALVEVDRDQVRVWRLEERQRAVEAGGKTAVRIVGVDFARARAGA